MENKILFLGPSDSPIFVWLKKNGENIFSTVEKITVDYIIENDFNFLISYGYRFILRKEILDLAVWASDYMKYFKRYLDSKRISSIFA